MKILTPTILLVVSAVPAYAQQRADTTFRPVVENPAYPAGTGPLVLTLAGALRSLNEGLETYVNGTGGDLWVGAAGTDNLMRPLHVQENDTDPDDCNHEQYGAFVLAGAGVAAAGEREGVPLLDMAPTLLELAGYGVPETMQGRVIPVGSGPARADGEPDPEPERTIRERLAGLGHIS